MAISTETALKELTRLRSREPQIRAEMEEIERSVPNRGTSPKWRLLLEELNETVQMSEWYENTIRGNSCKAQQLREASNLGERFLNRTFANFDKRRDEHAYRACSSYAKREDLFKMQNRDREFNLMQAVNADEDRYRNGLIILGGYGSGKTHLAASIANELVEHGIVCLFGTFSEHLEKIRQEFSTDRREYLEKMKGVPMLVIDDLGKEKKSEWTEQMLFDVTNYRYEHLLPMVITTNLIGDDLANHVGGAVMSRFMEMCQTVETRGSDLRDARNR